MRTITKKLILAALLIIIANFAEAQDKYVKVISDYLDNNYSLNHLNKADVSSFIITDNYLTKHNQARQIHIMQTRNNLPVYNGTANITINSKDEVVQFANRFIPSLPSSSALNNEPGLSSSQALISVLNILDLEHSDFQPKLIMAEKNEYLFDKSTISLSNIPVELIYWANNEKDIKLSWSIKIYTLDAEHMWHLIIDALTGSVINKFDKVIHCNHGNGFSGNNAEHEQFNLELPLPLPSAPPVAAESFEVYEFPVESPSHGNRTTAVSPADTVASPFGWLDTNGIPGAEYTYTRGNNAYAYEDSQDINAPGYSPDGGLTHEFIFPLNFQSSPVNSKDAIITNLFYANNRIHDITYHYGFDEVSGNFQANNYGNGGLGNDDVQAEAQDGGGTNNANFATDDDGEQPRMQMYLWSADLNSTFAVNSPESISGTYSYSMASGFGTSIPTSGITANVILVDDGTGADPYDGCDPIINSAAISGKIAIVRRGACSFVAKIEAAQNAGAIAVLVVNNVSGAPFQMGGTSTTIVIPSGMTSMADGEEIISTLLSGASVNITLSAGVINTLDGDLDNGIIAHEYTHGISNRLVGGPSNTSCLYNAEQMGEGWSDWVGCMLTLNLSMANPVSRPIGTYVTGEPVNGNGIRNAPYDTSFAVNDYTYADVSDIANISEPHGIGFVWATMLWDLTWAFMDQYGVDGDLTNGTGGDDIVFQLVIDGMKLCPCSPGFVDARDAILLADELNNNGANKCLIWKVFAKRGLGYSADQGSSGSRSDQTEAFDIPVLCQIATSPPTAGFEANTTETCNGKVFFTDLSYDTPQHWSWNFGDGQTDTIQNPFHQYSSPGTYTVTLLVSNNLGSNSQVYANYIIYGNPENPVVTDGEGCTSDNILLSASASGTINWLDDQMDFLATGTQFMTDPLMATTNFYVYNMYGDPSEQIGPQDENFGTGGYHNTSFVGTVDFTAHQELTIRSAYVNAESAGVRTVSLWDNFGGSGNELQQVVVNIPVAGPQHVDLDFYIPGPGNYSIGLNDAGLYRNDSGTNYPYEVANLLSIVGSPAGPDFYYYFYDLGVEPVSCYSDTVMVQAIISGTVEFSYQISNQQVEFSDMSVGATVWNWNFGDGGTSSLQNPVHTYTANGTYEVTLQTDIGNCIATQIVIVDYLGIYAIGDRLQFALQPNPAKGESTLSFDKSLDKDIDLVMIFSDGRVVRNYTLKAGKKEYILSLESLAPGIYYIRSKTQEQGIILKMIVY